MAGICCGLVVESEPALAVESSARVSRRRRLDLLSPIKIVADVAVAPPMESCRKRQKLEIPSLPSSSSSTAKELNLKCKKDSRKSERSENAAVLPNSSEKSNLVSFSRYGAEIENGAVLGEPKFGMTSVCGRRRDMEDAVSIHPSFHRKNSENLHFFGVFDGHGCSHVAVKCRERLHELLTEELRASTAEGWKETMAKSFQRMDREVSGRTSAKPDGLDQRIVSCRCELQSPQCDAVGSTAVTAIVTPAKIVASNCGDSRAVLCRNGVAIPLTSDHKPDRPDELIRIEKAGGRVIYWDGPRVLGVLAMSRAIGDNYLKPYVIPDPEVTVVDRTDDDECLILASDGLWDVVPNETACGVARMCLGAEERPGGHNGCTDAALLLTKLALARHSTDNVSVVVVDLRRNRRS